MARKAERGFVLITVLIIVSLLVPVVFHFFGKAQINVLQAENFRDTIQATRMARSGIEVALGILRNDDPSFDAKTDRWALPFPSIGMDGEAVEVTISDDDSKLNINALVDKDGNVDADIRSRLRSLIERFGGKGDFVNAVIDWLDNDNEVTEPDGAEAAAYRDSGYSVKNGSLDTLEELSLIKGFDRELFSRKGLVNYLTVAPTDGRLNINTASVELLSDLGFREGLVQEIANAREAEPFRNLSEAWRVLGIDPKSLPPNIDQKIKVNSSVFTVRSSCTINKIKKVVEAVVIRDKEKIKVLSWREY